MCLLIKVGMIVLLDKKKDRREKKKGWKEKKEGEGEIYRCFTSF